MDAEQANLVFRALADPSRRLLLDALRESDGQSLGQLCEHLDMTRFGVMKHVAVLEEADLIVARKVGREKLHYLNPVPLQDMYERWVGQYARPWAVGMTAIKSMLERESDVEIPKHVYQILIRATPERIWQAITDPAMTAQFWYNCTIESGWRVGDDYTLTDDRGKLAARGAIVESDPPRKLVMTWEWFVFPAVVGEAPSRITWEIRPRPNMPGVCALTVVHDEFDGAPNTYRIIGTGWPTVLSGLKTLLETGQPLVV